MYHVFLPPPDPRIPPRVRVALEFLQQLSFKTADRPSSSDSISPVIEGQRLTPAEIEAQETACGLLSLYFGGTLKPDATEALYLDNCKHQDQPQGVLSRCIACGDLPRQTCVLCGGTGKHVITPPYKE